jgi:hypothetical protein
MRRERPTENLCAFVALCEIQGSEVRCKRSDIRGQHRDVEMVKCGYFAIASNSLRISSASQCLIKV